MNETTIPQTDLEHILYSVEKPGRYTGGEYGIITKEGTDLLRVAISYPDLYEIGMSNLSVRLIYRLLNDLDGVSCERVFAPAMDFEAELRAARIPLYSLETRSPLRTFDVVGFSVGYELTFTNLLNILDLGNVSLYNQERTGGEPIVIAGGPAISNPAPFGAFIDAVFVGEIEGEGLEVFKELAALKRQGADRTALLEYLTSQPYIWSVDKNEAVRRVLWRGFGEPVLDSKGRVPFPVPNIRTVQDHGVVEIMRGCPNGCRFCHAGVFYRPYRLNDPEEIFRQVDAQVLGCGYREVTLSSLSSGDYPGITDLVKALTAYYGSQKVSFSLPSLRVNSLTLELFSEISSVRKSGLTFAVETPLREWQKGINKTVDLERTVDILLEAKRRGWRVAKFYFMVGLPVSEGMDESSPIIDFLQHVRSKTALSINVNVNCFIPKPHTPFQWARQLTEQEALDRIMSIKRSVSGRGIRVRYHSPFLSVLEGMVSRGDERVGEIMLRAFQAGARFDSWEEHVNWDLWRRLFAQADWDVEAETSRARDTKEILPWDSIMLGVSKKYMIEEKSRAEASQLTTSCFTGCDHQCGVCTKQLKPRELPLAAKQISEIQKKTQTPEKTRTAAASSSQSRRVLLAFAKTGKAVFLGHLDVIQIFERALLRAGYEVEFTHGFNPKPKLEFAQPISLGLESEREIALVEIVDIDNENAFRLRINRVLPEGIRIADAKILQAYRVGEKKHSLMSLYWGSEFLIRGDKPELIEDLQNRLSGRIDEIANIVDQFSLESSGIRLHIRRPEKGSGNILKLFTNLGVDDPLKYGYRIVRTRQLACDISNPRNVTDYFESSVLI